MRYAEVAVDAPTGSNRTFSYSCVEGMEVLPGHLVRVPFGARKLQGIVVRLVAVPGVPETRDIDSVLISEPLLSEIQVEVAEWLSRYYRCSLFEAAAQMLPPGKRLRDRTFFAVSPKLDNIEGVRLTELQERVVEFLNGKGDVDQERVVRLLGERVRPSLSSLVKRGVLDRSTRAAGGNLSHKYREVASLSPGSEATVREWLTRSTGKAPRQAALAARLLESKAPLVLAEARKEYGAGPVKALSDRGWLVKEREAVDRDPLEGRVFPPSPPVRLTEGQERVARDVCDTLGDPSAFPRTHLIQGVTGSGKTEVYLAAVERCLSMGKKAIVLVPEIALTYQTIERFASRFPGQVAVLHSGLSPGERHDQWWKVWRGDYGVVIGSRSAIFAPQRDLGLIVIDEEHEWTYKQHDANPRYHAREVAARFAELSGAVLILGSASPDVDSYFRGLKKEYRLHLLPDRVAANESDGRVRDASAPLADVKIVDMRRELRSGNRDMFSRELASAMDDCLNAGGQMMLFLNRRGSSSHMQCRSCGYSLRCTRCDVPLTYHGSTDRLLCHYCGLRRRLTEQCPGCLNYRMSKYGIGTQAVAEEVEARYPDVGVVRWDRDVPAGPKAYEEYLGKFRSGEARILVGTQMIAKGLHFPRVTLVGVVSADVGLNIPDYRVGERAFQILCQVAGRAGRGEEKGRVIFQTYQPENYAVRAAALQDYQSFYTQEMAYRLEQANPPYSKLIRLLFSHTNGAYCEQQANKLAGILHDERDAWGLSDVDILGPTPAYPTRIRGRYRWHIILRGPDPRILLDSVTVPARWVVDIDPVSLT
ncbi:MAG: primosomal protein N' [Chloroflexi bacterium]|nr:primosomal protein N' [Chloroflexota bacterium]